MCIEHLITKYKQDSFIDATYPPLFIFVDHLLILVSIGHSGIGQLNKAMSLSSFVDGISCFLFHKVLSSFIEYALMMIFLLFRSKTR